MARIGNPHTTFLIFFKMSPVSRIVPKTLRSPLFLVSSAKLLGFFDENKLEKRRERLKPALYLRLKKRKVFKIGGTIWAFWKSSLLQKIKKIDGGHFGHIKKFRKNVSRSQTSRDRPKTAPYLKIKNSKKTSKCQSIGELGTLRWIFFKKVSTPKKIERGIRWDFSTFIVAKLRKNRRDPLGTFFRKKVSQCRKKLNWKGDHLVSSCISCYAGNLFGSVAWPNGYNLAASS